MTLAQRYSTSQHKMKIEVNDILQEENLKLQYVKKGEGPFGEGAVFHIMGGIDTEADAPWFAIVLRVRCYW